MNVTVTKQEAAKPISFSSLLLLLFIGLKLGNVITWSWWWVLAPAWIPASIVLILVILVTIGTLIKTFWL